MTPEAVWMSAAGARTDHECYPVTVGNIVFLRDIALSLLIILDADFPLDNVNKANKIKNNPHT